MWLEMPENIPTGVEHGLVAYDALEDADVAYRQFLAELAIVWTPEAIMEFALSQKRTLYRYIATRIPQLERENADARAKGTSYQERQSFTVKLEQAHKALVQVQQQAEYLKRTKLPISHFVRPTDMPSIHKNGVEAYLSNLFITYPQLTVAVSQAKV